MSKFNDELAPGTKVRIRSDIKVENPIYGILFIRDMVKYFNQTYTIRTKHEDYKNVYRFVEVEYIWHKDWFDVIKD